MGGVGVERNVGDDAQFRKTLFQGAHHAGYQAFRIIGFGRIQAFERQIDHRENRQGRDAELDAFLRLMKKLVQGLP